MANQEMLMEIITEGMGFEFEAISLALIATGNSSKEAAIAYLIETAHDPGFSASAPVEPHTSSSSAVDELKEKFRNLDLNIPNDKVHEALQRSNNNPHQAFEWIMNELTQGRITDENESAAVGAVRPIRSERDAHEVKEQLAKKAEMRRQQQVEDARRREQELEEERRRFEGEAKEREERAAIHADAVRANRQKVQKAQKTKKKKANARRLEWHEKHENYDRNDAEAHATSRSRREAAEDALRTPDECIKMIFERYSEETAISVLQLLRKIVDKAIRNIDTDKFRRVDLTNRKTNALIVTPLGAAKFLKFLGFQEEEGGQRLVLPRDRADQAAMEQSISLLDSYLSFEDSPVIACVDECEEAKVDAQDLYFALQVTHDYWRNVTITPTSLHLTLIPVDEPHFRNFVGRFKEFIRLYKIVGFQLVRRDNGRFLKIDIDRSQALNASTHPQLRILKAGVRDCQRVSRRLIRQTHVVQCVNKLREVNVSSRQKTEKLFLFMVKTIAHVIDEPLEGRYHKLDMGKLKAKFGGVTGTVSIVKVVGYKNKRMETVGENTHTYMALDTTVDFELLKFKQSLLEFAIANPVPTGNQQ